MKIRLNNISYVIKQSWTEYLKTVFGIYNDPIRTNGNCTLYADDNMLRGV